MRLAREAVQAPVAPPEPSPRETGDSQRDTQDSMR
jgi:hypothetical protein